MLSRKRFFLLCPDACEAKNQMMEKNNILIIVCFTAPQDSPVNENLCDCYLNTISSVLVSFTLPYTDQVWRLLRFLKTGIHLHGQVDFHSEKCKHSELVLSGWRVKLIPASTDHHTQVWKNWKPWSVWVQQYICAICLVNHHNNRWLYNQLIWQNYLLKWQIYHVDLTFLSATSSSYRSRFRFIHIFL